MVLDATQVRVGITGQIYRAPLGSAAPTDSTSALPAAYVGLGYCSDDGVVENWDDSVDNIVAWQNATVVRAAVTESVGTLEFTLIQTNRAILEAYHRGSVVSEPAAGNYRIDVKPIVAAPAIWVLDVVDGAKHYRIYVGNGEVTERGEIQYVNGSPIGFTMTVTAYPDSSGNLMVKWSDDVAWDPTP